MSNLPSNGLNKFECCFSMAQFPPHYAVTPHVLECGGIACKTCAREDLCTNICCKNCGQKHSSDSLRKAIPDNILKDVIERRYELPILTKLKEDAVNHVIKEGNPIINLIFYRLRMYKKKVYFFF